MLLAIAQTEQPISRSKPGSGVAEGPFGFTGTAVGGDMTIRIPVGLPLIWNQEAIDALGKQPDAQLAKVLKINPKTVAVRRRSLNIPPWKPQRRILIITCVIDGKKTPARPGARLSQLRNTCPPDHRFTRTKISPCQRELIRRRLLARQGTSTSLKKIRRVPGMRFIGFDAPGLGD